MKKNHSKTLEDVLAELPDFKHPRWVTVNELIQHGQFFPLIPKHVPGPTEWWIDDKKKKHPMRIFPQDEWECPILASQFLPCKMLPRIEEVKLVLKEEIRTQKFHFSPKIIDANTKHATALQLIESLETKENNPVLPLNRENWFPAAKPPTVIDSTGKIYGESIVHMFSPSLQNHCDKKFTVDGVKGTLSQSPHQVTIMPTGGYLETVYHHHYTVSTLFHGKKLWIVFPENPQNIETLTAAFTELSSGDSDLVHKSWREQIRVLQNGIVFVQSVGETVILPPFWQHMTMSIEASLSTTSYVAKSTYFPLRLKYMHLSNLVKKMWPDDIQYQEHMVAFAKEFANHFHQVMSAEGESSQSVDTKTHICGIWKDTRREVTGLIASIGDLKIRESLATDVQQAFITCLEYKARISRKCSICKQSVNSMIAPQQVPKEDLLRSKLERHFLRHHWD